MSYNTYGEFESDSLSVDGDTHLITELRDEFGRSIGYTYAKNGSVQQTVHTGYGADGRINSAGFVHGGATKNFGFEYVPGTNLLQTLTKPNGMTLTQTYEAQRDLLIGMAYRRGSSLVVQREYSYDELGRPTARNTARQGAVVNDIFAHNSRSELSSARVNGVSYGYAYDSIGNREFAVEGEDTAVYTANALNQYTRITENAESVFIPEFDADGNQTRIKTETGIWGAVYNSENRPVTFSNADSGIVVESAYDSMGRRTYKRVTLNGSVTLHQRYIYRGYLQIACIDLTRSHHPCMWLLCWDPTQRIATRPLAIQKDGTWYTYGLDLTKNVCEVFGTTGYINTAYTYTPYGSVTATGSTTQPIQWSSEFYDSELALVYYNYRHYNPVDGRWIGRDILLTNNLFDFINNSPYSLIDLLGAWGEGTHGDPSSSEPKGHTDLGSLSGFNYAKEDEGLTHPFVQPWLHFKDIKDSESDLLHATQNCDKSRFESYMHQMQDFYSHYAEGYRWYQGGHILEGHSPDNPEIHSTAFDAAKKRTIMWEGFWMICCCMNKKGNWIINKNNRSKCLSIKIPEPAYPVKESKADKSVIKEGKQIERATRIMPTTTGKNLFLTR